MSYLGLILPVVNMKSQLSVLIFAIKMRLLPSVRSTMNMERV